MTNIQLKKELSIYKREDHTKVQNLSHNHRSKTKTSRMYPELVKPQKITDSEATYYAALELVARIDEDLTQGIRPSLFSVWKFLKTGSKRERKISVYL